MIKHLDITDRHIANQVLQVQIPAYQVEAQIVGLDEIPPLKDTVDSLQSSKEDFLGYYESEILVGVISFRVMKEVLDIHRVVVHPSYFRRGIGRTMIQYLLDKYKNQVKGCKVQTASANTPAINLYQSLGFQKLEQFMISPPLSLTVFYIDQTGVTHFLS
ncbi:GNAT family N-acetyltransferase [Shimazuella alba]|uniref:GNAT family N-acetyltransferase n=1 Tax=Shimazuella alba TaxID=2690964 RepID=A0A6I4VR96_9BACL|nr:GNAT family N-acetyltransferase [Shimazuella alba]MXQ52938.1 GNAT family N-acetyltransferase [Shimazuella alba]